MDEREESKLEVAVREARETSGGSGDLNAATQPVPSTVGPTGLHVDQAETSGDPLDTSFPIGDDGINNAGSNPEGDLQRTGGSPNDPDGGHELLGGEWRGPDPDPIDEMVPGGQGAEAPPYGKPVPESVATVAAEPGIGTTRESMPAPETEGQVQHEGIIRMESDEPARGT